MTARRSCSPICQCCWLWYLQFPHVVLYLAWWLPLCRWRGRLNTIVQLGTISGIVVANAINIGTNKWIAGWRISLGLAAVPGTVLLLGEPSQCIPHAIYLNALSLCPPLIHHLAVVALLGELFPCGSR